MPGMRHFVGRPRSSVKYMPAASMDSVPALYSSIQSSNWPWGSLTILLLDAMNSLITREMPFSCRMSATAYVAITRMNSEIFVCRSTFKSLPHRWFRLTVIPLLYASWSFREDIFIIRPLHSNTPTLRRYYAVPASKFPRVQVTIYYNIFTDSEAIRF